MDPTKGGGGGRYTTSPEIRQKARIRPSRQSPKPAPNPTDLSSSDLSFDTVAETYFARGFDSYITITSAFGSSQSDDWQRFVSSLRVKEFKAGGVKHNSADNEMRAASYYHHHLDLPVLTFRKGL